MTALSPRSRLVVLSLAAALLSALLVPASAQAAARSRLSLGWTDTSVTVGQVVSVRGRVSPARKPRTVVLQRRTSSGWQAVRSRRTTEGAFRLRFTAQRRGEFRYRVRVRRTAAAGAVTSTAKAVRVRRAARGSARSFDFISRADADDPIARWNPCEVIGYRVNARQGGAGALADAKEAVARIHRANGLRFAYRGSTDIVPGGETDREYPADTDLVIAWARPSESTRLEPGVAGVGGPRWVYWTENGTPKAMITRGYALLNAELPLGGGFGGGVHNGYYGTRGQLLMHEIGHAIGLDHPSQDDRWQIMYPTMTEKRARWGAGDLRGLSKLGTAPGCIEPPSYGSGFAGPSTWTVHRH